MGEVIEFNKIEKLHDVTAAFKFSRLPREQRIAQTLFKVLAPGPQVDEYIIKFTKPEDLMDIATELAQYSVKDFAVRYGHLNDGKA